MESFIITKNPEKDYISGVTLYNRFNGQYIECIYIGKSKKYEGFHDIVMPVVNLLDANKNIVATLTAYSTDTDKLFIKQE